MVVSLTKLNNGFSLRSHYVSSHHAFAPLLAGTHAPRLSSYSLSLLSEFHRYTVRSTLLLGPIYNI